MNADTTPNAQTKHRRRWYQFGLRTLLIGVTLLALPCAYVGWQYRIVRERKAVLDEISARGAALVTLDVELRQDPMNPNLKERNIGAVRRWLGDAAVVLVFIQWDDVGSPFEARIKASFPEAHIEAFITPPVKADPSIFPF